jgi:hypothetical protein
MAPRPSIAVLVLALEIDTARGRRAEMSTCLEQHGNRLTLIPPK